MSCILAAVTLSVAALQAAERDPRIEGTVRVIDADTFDVGGTRVRLHAIDAPELDQTCETASNPRWACGGWVSKVVSDRYEGLRATCTPLDIDRYGRVVARCRVGGEDVGGWLVSEGLAFAYIRYGADYAGHERRAASADRGLHAVRIQRPAQHRAARGGQPPNGNCPIKGNVNAQGTRIYHLPGQAFYSRTRISTGRGERWFCSEGAAQAAGWRASRR